MDAQFTTVPFTPRHYILDGKKHEFGPGKEETNPCYKKSKSDRKRANKSLLERVNKSLLKKANKSRPEMSKQIHARKRVNQIEKEQINLY